MSWNDHGLELLHFLPIRNQNTITLRPDGHADYKQHIRAGAGDMVI
jgi:hypothetical protein